MSVVCGQPAGFAGRSEDWLSRFSTSSSGALSHVSAESSADIPKDRTAARYPAGMATERQVLDSVVSRLERALERGTGTTFDAEEVRVVGRLIYAMGSVALGTAIGREACGVCGRPEHKPQAVGQFPAHEYQRAILVPIAAPEQD